MSQPLKMGKRFEFDRRGKVLGCGPCMLALAGPSADDITGLRIGQAGANFLSNILDVVAGGNSPVQSTQPAPAPAAAPAPTQIIKGVNNTTLMIGGIAAVAAYFIFKK